MAAVLNKDVSLDEEYDILATKGARVRGFIVNREYEGKTSNSVKEFAPLKAA
jgi:hypothetical protein